MRNMKPAIAIGEGMNECKFVMKYGYGDQWMIIGLRQPDEQIPHQARNLAGRRGQVQHLLTGHHADAAWPVAAGAVQQTLLTMEAAILERLQFAVIQAGLDQNAFLRTEYLETITDEDRLPHYKLFAMRWRVEG